MRKVNELSKATGCLVGFLGLQAQAATYNLAVNLSDSIRPVTHCASGSLYGITETLPSDISGLVAPLHPNAFNQPAMAGSGHQQPIGGAIKVSERIATTTGKVQLRLADVYPGWPYKWISTSDYKTQVTSVIKAKIASGRSNYSGYEIWNEPNGTWPAANGDFNTICWKPTFDLIRSLDPGAKIVGPSYSYYDNNAMSAFLAFARDKSCLPDIVSWHQWGSEGFAATVQTYRALEKTLGISPREISINEYSSGTHTYEGCPGVSVPFIAKFERYKVESAMISWWFTGLPGRLGSLLTSANAKGGGWWLYKWYGDMTGYMANVSPPNDKSDGVDAFASFDRVQAYASIVVGGNSVGTVNVNIGGVPASFGSSVSVKIESVSWSDKDSPVSGTTMISNNQYAVKNGAITVPVELVSQFYAYRLTLATSSMGLQRAGVNRQIEGEFDIYGPLGKKLGAVSVPIGAELGASVSKICPRPGVYFAKRGESVTKVVVGR